MYRLRLSKSAVEFYEDADNKTVKRLNRGFERISINPFYGKNVKKLHGELEGLYRYRLDSPRIVYRVLEKEKLIEIIYIDFRKDVYR